MFRRCVQLTSVMRGAPRRAMCAHNMGESGYKHSPSPFDKRVLVWNSHYKSVDEVPKTVDFSTMKKAKDWFRIRFSIGMMIATAIAAGIMIKIGRDARMSGESVVRQNLEWHAQNRARVAAEKNKN